MAKKPSIAKAVATAVQAVDGAYVNLVSNLNTGRDKASYGQFVKSIGISDYELEAVYQDWLAKKIVDRPVSDMLRAGWYFDGLSEQQTVAFNEACRALQLVPRIGRLLRLTRLYGKAYMLIGVSDTQSADQLAVPLTVIRPRSLQFLTVVKKGRVVPGNVFLPLELTAGLEEQPEYYTYHKPNNSRVQIHHSRVIELKHGDDGESLLEALYNTLRQFAGTNAGASSLVHEAKVDVIRSPSLMQNIKERMSDVMARFQAAALMKSINGMLVLDKDEEYASKQYSFGGLPELMREFAIQTSGAADIPYTVLFGQSPAGMNSTGEHDTRNYYDGIATQQEWVLRPLLEKLFSLIAQSAIGGLPAGFGFTFQPLWQLDPKTRSEVEKNNAERDRVYVESGVIEKQHVARQLKEDGTYTVIDDAHISLLETIAGPLDDNPS